MIYDTMSSWTSILESKTTGYTILSNYVQEQSRTANQLYRESVGNQPMDFSVKLGQSVLVGRGFKDNICLYQTKE